MIRVADYSGCPLSGYTFPVTVDSSWYYASTVTTLRVVLKACQLFLRIIITVESSGSIIKGSRPDKLIAVAGVKDLVVIDTDDALLVIPKDRIDKIKDIQAILKERSETEYL